MMCRAKIEQSSVGVGAGAAVVPSLVLNLFGSHDVKRIPQPWRKQPCGAD